MIESKSSALISTAARRPFLVWMDVGWATLGSRSDATPRLTFQRVPPNHVTDKRGDKRGRLRLCCSRPRIYNRHSPVIEICDIPCDNGQFVHDGGRGDERIALRAGIGNVQSGRVPRNGEVDRQDALREHIEHVVFQPAAEALGLLTIPPLQTPDPDLDLHHGDDAYEQAGSSLLPNPPSHARISQPPGLAQFTQHIRVEQISHSSGTRNPNSTGVGSKSMSSSMLKRATRSWSSSRNSR